MELEQLQWEQEALVMPEVCLSLGLTSYVQRDAVRRVSRLGINGVLMWCSRDLG